MEADRRKIEGPIFAVFIAVLILLPLALCVAGYVWLSARFESDQTEEVVRVFNDEWQATVYAPAAKVEGQLSWQETSTGASWSGWGW